MNNPMGPARDIPIDVTQGTWMSVDVSPDGTEIVFDMLGDLYVMPIGGGPATNLTSGVAWDMHPRWSPTGAPSPSPRTGAAGTTSGPSTGPAARPPRSPVRPSAC
ncbi:hypothetical protein [Brevundimonas abyssalis]|uniref:hypothetical protein n=1 Tax=Brevundimonas abyssalis TaxID=1125965 RepID=UPI0004181D20|nr:hypothetical protein [Brevundimonas abyssalis]